ncbi:DUF5004 domain-containing protein [Bacteroides sp. AN502(2024)]|uniref:DUF5004 domain-containing protein n=1 Tax=Bacteroides sp. AN502(2024) TaxID=3160599 RepID=UPI0035170606
MKQRIYLTAVVLLTMLWMVSCDTFSASSDPDKNMEQEKDVSGTWQLITVSRNGNDITDAMDFSQFKLHLKKDGNYTIENYLPFVVRHDGKWKVDDVYFPFRIYFTEEGSTDQASTEILFPITNGERNIIITHSPGCVMNSYTYVFKKISEN